MYTVRLRGLLLALKSSNVGGASRVSFVFSPVVMTASVASTQAELLQARDTRSQSEGPPLRPATCATRMRSIRDDILPKRSVSHAESKDGQGVASESMRLKRGVRVELRWHAMDGANGLTSNSAALECNAERARCLAKWRANGDSSEACRSVRIPSKGRLLPSSDGCSRLALHELLGLVCVFSRRHSGASSAANPLDDDNDTLLDGEHA